MDSAEILDRHDAVGLAALVRSGAVSARELLEAAVARIAERDPAVNAVIARRADAARAEIDAGLPEGPLRGVPFLVKDLSCDIAGLPTTNGSRLFADAVAPRDGELVRRYRRAGLVMLGKTNTPEFGKNASTEPLLHGATRNPWRPTHSAGGSSGGSAAAVAAGMVPAAHANDGGGSTRIPAACCGLFGLKPSRGRVPNDDGLSTLSYPMSAAHAVTRTVRDSAALLDAAAGPVPGDAFAGLPAPEGGSFSAVLRQPLRPLRIGVAVVAPNGIEAHAAGVRAVRRTAELLASLGHHVEEAAPSWDMARAASASGTVMSVAVRAKIEDRLAALGRDLAADDIEPFSRFMHDRIASLPASDVSRALRDVELIGRQVAPYFDRFDVWLTPTLAVGVPELGLLDTTDPAAMGEHAAKMTWFTSVFNIAGLPAASVPAGLDDNGLPVGVQIAGRMGAEADLLRLAAQLEEAAPWPWTAPWPQAAAARA
ncbi:amidase [Streptomycetaceae bacterium NBC_01309]